MLAGIASAVGRRGSVARNAQGLRQYTANFARNATITAQTSLRKSVQLASEYLMSVMVANRSVNVP